MFMPTIFHENLFDDFFDPFWNDGALERAMNREERETFGKRGANMMKTDVKQTADGSYDVAVDLPGCKKEDVQMELNDGYLTIQPSAATAMTRRIKRAATCAARPSPAPAPAASMWRRREEGGHPRKVRGWHPAHHAARTSAAEGSAGQSQPH